MQLPLVGKECLQTGPVLRKQRDQRQLIVFAAVDALEVVRQS
jgi:hypothetical protein